MNIAMLQSIGRFFCLVVVSVSSLFSTSKVESNVIGINNADKLKSSSVVNTVIKFDTIYNYNSKIPSGIEKVVTKGQNGIVYLDTNGNIFKKLSEKTDEVIEVGIGRYGEYSGIITGYGPDCDTCDGRGYLACPTSDGQYKSLINDGIYYNDIDFGDIRILAADQREFPCGTIIEVNNSDLDKPIIGVVMDTGYAMRRAYDNNYIHIDLAFQTEQGLDFKINKNTNFSVKRWGW